MIAPNNSFTQMQRDFYNREANNMAIENHRGHNYNPDYRGILLADIQGRTWDEKRALDFGCGAGRNIANLLCFANWEAVDGCDISQANIENAARFLREGAHKDFSLYVTSGIDLQPIPSNRYDFVLSTLVLQHIPVWTIRFSILRDIFRVMKEGGLFSFQMARHGIATKSADYYEDRWDVKETNGAYDVSVDNSEELRTDLLTLGFSPPEVVIRPAWDSIERKYETDSEWVFVKAWKPASTSSTFSTP